MPDETDLELIAADYKRAARSCSDRGLFLAARSYTLLADVYGKPADPTEDIDVSFEEI